MSRAAAVALCAVLAICSAGSVFAQPVDRKINTFDGATYDDRQSKCLGNLRNKLYLGMSRDVAKSTAEAAGCGFLNGDGHTLTASGAHEQWGIYREITETASMYLYIDGGTLTAIQFTGR